MQITFFSECPKTMLFKHKICFIIQRIKKLNFYFAVLELFLFFGILKAFLEFQGIFPYFK